MDRKRIICGLLAVLAFTAPFLYLLVRGVLSLGGFGAHFWAWLLGASLLWILAWILLVVATKPRSTLIASPGSASGSEHLSPEEFWGNTELEAWSKILPLIANLSETHQSLPSWEALKSDTEKLQAIIARSFFPKSSIPESEVRVVDILKAVEFAARELRNDLLSQFPFARSFRLSDISKIQRTTALARASYDVYRLVRAVVNPFASVASEFRELVTKEAAEQVSTQSLRWMLCRVYEEIAKQLITAYSGLIPIFDNPFDAHRQVPHERHPASSILPELRITLIGQTGAGKSSFVNALLGEYQSPESPVPETSEPLTFSANFENLGKVLLIDTPGLAESLDTAAFVKKFRETLLRSDLICLLVPANSGSRHEELIFLSELTLIYNEEPSLSLPPVLIGLSKIDLLRPFQSWDPPINVMNPELHETDSAREKARNVRRAIESVGEDLKLPLETIIPLSFRPDSPPYNLDCFLSVAEELLPTMKRSLLRRMIKAENEINFWKELSRGFKFSGRLLVSVGKKFSNPTS